VSRAIAARQSASNDGYNSRCFTFSSLSSTAFKSSSISTSFSSSSSLLSLSDDVYAAIRHGFFNFFGDFLSIVVGCERFLLTIPSTCSELNETNYLCLTEKENRLRILCYYGRRIP
jgi:hypothetical protein